MESFAEIIDKAQRNTAFHRNCIGKLRALKDDSPRNFVKQWLDLLNRVLVQSKKHASVERLVKLIASVAVSFDEAFRDFTVQYVVRKTESRDWAPRFRACQILSQTLKALPEDAELGDDIWDEIKRRMSDRLDDRAPAVRSEAVTAVQRLQDPSDPEDAIVARFCEMMRDDPSGDVRKTVICHVAICKASLKELVERTRDVHPPARRAAYRVLSGYVNVKNLKISQRTQLLRDGLRDRDEKVRNECSKMCLQWLQHSEMDVLALLRLVDVEIAEEGAELLLRTLFRDAQGANPVRIEPKEKLSPEAALYMRVLAEFWKERVDDAASQECFEMQVPELTSVCTMMEINAGADFVLKQLLFVALLRDFGDEAGRTALSALLRSLLPSPQVSQYLVEPIIKVLSLCHANESEFIQVVLEMVADVREPLDMLQTDEAKLGFAKAVARRDEMRVKLAKLRKIARVSQEQGLADQLRKALAKAQSIKADLERADEAIATRSRLEEHIWFRVLCVTELLLENTRQGLKHPGILGLLEGILMPSLQQPSVVVREKALRCLAMYCLLDRTTDTVRAHVKVFLDYCRAGGDLQLRTTAAKSLFDIGMLYGFGALQEEQLIQTLSVYVTDEAQPEDMRGLVVEGFAKLFLMDQCQDVDMLGSLLLLFFSPFTAGEIRLRQCLSVFFPAFAFSSRAHQTLCADALVPAMRRILLADPSSMLRKIDWSLFAKFGAHLLEPANARYDLVVVPADEPSWHERVMLRMAYEMRGEEKSHNQYWARALANFACRPPTVPDDGDATAARVRFVAKLLTALTASAEETVDKRARQWAEKRAASVRDTLLTGDGGRLATRALLREVADEQEVEVEQYLEERRAAVAALLKGAAPSARVYEVAPDDGDDDKSPVKKKSRAKAAATGAKSKGAAAPSVAAKTNWGISVAGEEQKKRERRKAAGKEEPDAAAELESPPKKEKTEPAATRKRKEPVAAAAVVAVDAQLMDLSGDDDGDENDADGDGDEESNVAAENVSPSKQRRARNNKAPSKRSKSPPQASVAGSLQ